MLEKEDMQHKNLISTRPKAHEARLAAMKMEIKLSLKSAYE